MKDDMELETAATPEITAQQIWAKYQAGQDHNAIAGIPVKVAKCHRFYEGDQWTDEQGTVAPNLPMYNIIEPTVNYKVATIAQNSMTPVFSPSVPTPEKNETCDRLNAYIRSKMKAKKLATAIWDTTEESCVTGDGILYFYNKDLDYQMVDSDQIYFGDEQQQEVQKQPYILIFDRMLVSDAKEMAKASGVPGDMIAEIVPDADDNETTQAVQEVNDPAAKKCNTVLYMTKYQGNICFCRSTKTVIFQPMQAIQGMEHYPIAKLTWKPKHRDARGNGEVYHMIPNQIEINKTLYRRLSAVRSSSFPRPVYVEDMIENPAGIMTVGEPIKVASGNVNRIDEVFKMLDPAPISPEAANIQKELMDVTRDLANAGDAVTGNINPEQASGASIAIVRDAQAVPLNKQKAATKQFVEDIAVIMLDYLTTYATEEITLSDGRTLRREDLAGIEAEIRVDVSDGNPYSKFARESELKASLDAGYITFPEYVSGLDEESHAPKGKYIDILKRRGEWEEDGGAAIEDPEALPEEMQMAPEMMAPGMMPGVMPGMAPTAAPLPPEMMGMI